MSKSPPKSPESSISIVSSAGSLPLPLHHEPSSLCITSAQFADQSCQTGHSSETKRGRRTAFVLLFAHIVELTVMAVATLTASTPLFFNEIKSGTQINVISCPKPVIFVYLCVFILPHVVITVVSFILALKSQDFSGRKAAQIVCWVLHILQTSIIWRYLKIHLAYDSSDVTELKTLRFIQVYIHTLPFLIVHTIAIILSPTNSSMSFIIAGALLLSIVISIDIATTTKQTAEVSSLSPPTITKICHSPLHQGKRNHFKNAVAHTVVCVITICILWCRILATAVLFSLHVFLAACLVLLHWLSAVFWIKFNYSIKSSNSWYHAIRQIFLGYLLYWDLHICEQCTSFDTVCAKPQIPAAFFSLLAAENIAATTSWYVVGQYNNSNLLCTAALSSVVVVQIVALLLLILSYLYCSSLLPRWTPEKVASASASRKPSLVTNNDKNVICSGIDNSTILVTSEDFKHHKLFEKSDSLQCSDEVDCSSMGLHKQSTPCSNVNNFGIAFKHPQTLAPKLLTQRLPPSIFSYSSDLIGQNHTNSERSSTENGSFNSRNTNTLKNSPALNPNCNVYESFSESFSSLSCGTTAKVVTSTPKNIPNNACISSSCKLLRHSSCRSEFCYCKLLKQIAKKNTTLENKDAVSMCEESTSPPRVSVVRGTQRFQVICLSCLHAHDPLLSECLRKPNQDICCSKSCKSDSSTDYPSDTEVTATLDTLSTMSVESQSSYSTWPVGKSHSMAKILMKDKDGNDYVTAWLRHQQNGNTCIISPKPNTLQLPQSNEKRRATQPPVRKIRNRKPIRKNVIKASLVQDLETVV